MLDFLEAALTDGAVGGLGRHQQQRRVIPVGGLDTGDEIGDAGTVLSDAESNLAVRARVAVAHVGGIALVRDVPEGYARLREQVRDRHERRADDAKGMLDAMHLQHLYEGLFRRHAHRQVLRLTWYFFASLNIAPRAAYGHQKPLWDPRPCVPMARAARGGRGGWMAC